MLQLYWGDNLFVYDIHDDVTIKIAELDYNFNFKKKTFSSTGSHSLLIHFTTDHYSVLRLGFSALIHHIPNNTTSADILDKTELLLTNANDYTNWIITAPFVTSTINITFQYFEVYHDLTS